MRSPKALLLRRHIHFSYLCDRVCMCLHLTKYREHSFQIPTIRTKFTNSNALVIQKRKGGTASVHTSFRTICLGAASCRQDDSAACVSGLHTGIWTNLGRISIKQSRVLLSVVKILTSISSQRRFTSPVVPVASRGCSLRGREDDASES